MGDSERAREFEVPPSLPTSGQILGAVARSMGLKDFRLQSRTARRYFSGRSDTLVKESSRTEVVEAISDALAELGFGAVSQGRDVTTDASVLASTLEWHASSWDSLRTFLLPRMMRVYPSHLAAVWQTYVRLAVIDLALRTAAQLHPTDSPEETLDFLGWIAPGRRGAYLNQRRRRAGVTLTDFVEWVGVSVNAAEGWLYRGVRPSDENLREIAKALTRNGADGDCQRTVRELRLLYWVSDMAEALGEHIGAEAVEEIVNRLQRYALLAYRTIRDSMTQARSTDLDELAAGGAHSSLAGPLLAMLGTHEPDKVWQKDLAAVGSGWIGRVLEVNLQVHRTEEDALIRETDGRILESWGVGNVAAYEHYRQSMELQMKGRMDAALTEVARAAALDPLDPVYHFILGSVRGGIGARNGDQAMVSQSLEECWVAVNLDPTWILPWTEIGWILLSTGRAEEAARHLKGVRPGCGPPDARYHAAMGVALRQVGRFVESLTALESSLELDPSDMSVVVAAAGVAYMTGDKLKSNHYGKVACHLGASEELYRHMEMLKAITTVFPVGGVADGHDREIAELDAAIRGNPGNAALYIARGRARFLKQEDSRAVSDLDAALRLDPSNEAAYVLIGMVYCYMKRYDQVVLNMSEAIRLNPGSVIAHYYRGIAHGELDALDLAVADLTEVIRLEPDHADASWCRGESHLRKGEYDLAIADFDTALRLNPDEARSYRGRGAALRMKGELDRAIAELDVALRIDPVDPYAYRFRGDAYLAKHEWARAIADFDATLRMNGADDVAFRSRGNAHLFNGELELAIADFDAALECNPESAPAAHGRGLARELMGDADGAEYDYRRARDLGYDDST